MKPEYRQQVTHNIITLGLAVEVSITTGNATAAYVYSRMLTRYAYRSGMLKPTLENDVQWRLEQMTRVLLLAGRYTELEARQLAREVLGE